MPHFRTGTVTSVVSERAGLQRVEVLMPDGATARAYVLSDLLGTVAVGDEVVCNTTAVDLGLGTGGSHVVHWNLSRRELHLPGPDHVMKLRYTSLQSDVGTSELLHRDLPASLGGAVVVATQVHSQVGVVAATIAAIRPGTRVVYVMTDGAALPMVLSDLVVSLRDLGAIDATVSAGHAFGGDLEAVTVASALSLAVHVAGAEVVIAGMGPGVVGTGTELGTTAIEAAHIVDTVDALGGRAVMCLRASSGDERSRHQGVSHHTQTALRLARSRPRVAVVEGAGDIDPAHGAAVHVEPPDIEAILDAAGLRITTMGRDVTRDRLFFDAAAAAGALAVRELDGA